MKHKLLYALASAMILVTGASHAQDKKTLAIVVKGLDNPFFEQINLGCQEWMKNNPDSEYECIYTGPASSTDEAGEVQIVDDLLTRGVAAIAISPSKCAGNGQPHSPDRTGCAGDDHRRGLPRAGPRPARHLSWHRQLPDGRQDGRAGRHVEARWRLRLPAAWQRRGRTTSMPARRASAIPPAAKKGSIGWTVRTAGPKSKAARSSPMTRPTLPTSRWPTPSPPTPISMHSS